MERANAQRKRALVIAVIIALLFGAYFLRDFFSVIAFSMIAAYISNPLYHWLLRKLKHPNAAAWTTFGVSIFVIIIPVALLILMTISQTENVVQNVKSGHFSLSQVSDFGSRSLASLNSVLSHLPGDYSITSQHVNDAAQKIVSAVAQGTLSFLQASVGSIASFFIMFIIYIYLFLNVLMHQKGLVDTIKKLNPLGEKATDAYLQKMGKMTIAMVRGQFVIAAMQGLIGATLLYIGGLHQVFFFMFLLLTVLSIIPLGSGVVTLPIGVILLFTGQVWQGLVVIIGHLLIVTSIDNILRPHLVPKSVHLNSALTILSVFAGIAMFGFLGVVIGPVVMIMILTTIQLYVAVQQQKAPRGVEQSKLGEDIA